MPGLRCAGVAVPDGQRAVAVPALRRLPWSGCASAADAAAVALRPPGAAIVDHRSVDRAGASSDPAAARAVGPGNPGRPMTGRYLRRSAPGTVTMLPA